MNKHQELERASEAVDNTKQDLMSINIRLSAIEREIDVYLLAELQLIENIRILKTNKIIALAEQYKRSKEELETIRQKLALAYSDRSRHEKAVKITQTLLNKAQLHYDIVVKRYENNVVHGLFRRNNGQG